MNNKVGKKIVDILIEQEGRDKKIAFLPYKVEMWDSLKSVYVEARKAKLNVKVCPIPYNILEQNRVRACKYDDWRDFRTSGNYLRPDELKDFDPDIVILHYPYDYQNAVTSLPSEFFSSVFKRQGKKIVYIPYHGSTIYEKAMPVLLNSDYIFIRNVKEKSGLQLSLKERSNTGVKIFAVGSPKQDLLKHNRYSSTAVIINSIAPFINDKNRIAKYQAIIDNELAKGHKVLFRPHPLILDTILTVQSGRQFEYYKFLEHIQKQGVLIDNSKYVYNVINQCGTIYCDPASISSLCQEAHIKVNII